MAEGESESEEGEKKSKKKLIFMGVGLLVVALLVAKMTILKPPPLTDAQAKLKAAATQYKLETKCAEANGVPAPTPPKDVPKLPTPPVPPAPKAAAVLSLDSITINLADGHFLKLGLSLSFPAGTAIATIKDTNPGAAALNYVILQLQQKTMAQVKNLAVLQQQFGYKVCSDPTLNDGGLISTIYFTDFVSQ